MPFELYSLRPREPRHPLLCSRYFTRWLCFPDAMHMVDCKGVAALVYGGILATLLKLRCLGRNKQDRLRAINQRRQEWYAGRAGGGNPMPTILMSSLTSNGWGDLSGPAIKAAMTRDAAPFFEHISEEYLRDGDEQHHLAYTAASRLADYYRLIQDGSRFLTDEQIRRLRTIILEFGDAYQRLRSISRQRGELLWPVRPKVHKFMHIPQACAVMNVRFLICYLEESLIGTTTNVWKKTLSGRWKGVAQKHVLLKRLTGLLLRFEGAE